MVDVPNARVVDASAESAEAGAPVIEVTEAMVNAARTVLNRRYLGEGVYDVSDPFLCDLFRAMSLARLQHGPQAYQIDLRAD